MKPENSPRPGRKSWRAWVLFLLATSVLGSGVLLWPAWRRHQAVAHLAANIPVRPADPKIATILTERLARAEAAVKIPASAVEGLAELGRLYHANGYREQAEACWRALCAAQPREARWCYYLADLDRDASNYAGMAERLAQTTQRAPAYAPAWLRLADLELKTGQLAEAARDYEKRLTLVPNDPYASLGLVRIALQTGRTDEARRRVEQLIKAAPEFSPGHNLYAEMLTRPEEKATALKQRWLGRETGRFRDAEDPWLEELDAACFNYGQLCIRGSVQNQTKRGDNGKSCFERAIALQPGTLIAYDLLGSLYLESSDAARARETFESGLQRAPDDKPAASYFVHLSRAYRELKQPAEAARVARTGLARLGEEFELYDALGTALGDLGERDAAVAALEKAVALNPGDSNANYNLAIALIAVRQLDPAVKALHRSLELKPTFPSSLALLAQIEIDSGRWESAAQYLQPLYESHPEMPRAREMMIAWHLHLGAEAETKNDRAAAEEHYRAGLAIQPGNRELLERLGALYLVAGRFSDAVDPLEAFHRLEPDNPRSAFFLGQAYAALGKFEDARATLTKGVQAAAKTGDAATAEYCREILRHLP